MKQTLVFLFSAVLLGACSDDPPTLQTFHDDPSITSLNGTWKVTSFIDFTAHKMTVPSEQNSWNKEIVITFDDSAQDKFIYGTVTTNTVAGEFRYVSEREITVSNYRTTFANQPPIANEFTDAITDDVVRFEVNTTSLRLYYADNTKCVALTKR